MTYLSGYGRLGLLAVLVATSCSLWSTDNDSVVTQHTPTGGTSGAGGAGGADPLGGAGTRATQPTFDFAVPEGPVSIEHWAQKSAEAVCAYLDTHIPVLLSWGNYFTSEEPCVDYFEGRLRDRLDLEGLVAAGELTYDPVAFGACLTKYASKSDSQWEPVQCLRQLGTLGVGASCTADLQCLPNMRCETSEYCGVGTCVVSPAEGDTCTSTGRPSCGVGLGCVEGKCQRAQIKGTCSTEYFDYSNFCATGLNCRVNGLDGDYTGKCRRTLSIDCAAGWAVQEFEDESGNVGYRCVLGPLLGEACATDEECTHDNYCEQERSGTKKTGTCSSRHALGERCSSKDPVRSCVLGARCDVDSLTCVEAKLARLGELCVDNGDCYSASCVEGLCVRPPLCQADFVR